MNAEELRDGIMENIVWLKAEAIKAREERDQWKHYAERLESSGDEMRSTYCDDDSMHRWRAIKRDRPEPKQS